MRGIGLLLVVLLTVLLTVLPANTASSNLTAQDMPDKPLRKICFNMEGELWWVNEDGSDLNKLSSREDPYGRGCSWSPDGRYLSYDIRERGIFGLSVEIMGLDGGRNLSIQGRQERWTFDSSKLVVADHGVDRLGWPAYIYHFVRPQRENKDEEVIEKTLFFGVPTSFSPKLKYRVLVEKVSQPLFTEGMGDYFIHQLLVFDNKTDSLVVQLTNRANVRPIWSENEDKLVFFERDPATLEVYMVVYSLPNKVLYKTTDVSPQNPVYFLPDNKSIVYFNKDWKVTVVNFESWEKEVLTNLDFHFPSDVILEENFSLREAGTKLVYISYTTGNPATSGIFVYDLETRQNKRIVSEGIIPWDIAVETFVYALKDGLYITDIEGRNPRRIVTGNVIGAVRLQPIIPPELYKIWRVLVLAQGIGSEVKEGYPRNVFPEYWPIINEALARGIYQDVIVFSYAGGRMENGRWLPTLDQKEASHRSIHNSALIFSRTLSEYATVHPETTYDIIGHSLGGKIAWEYLKIFVLLGEKARPFNIGKLITLGSPLNGRHRDYLFEYYGQWREELVDSQAADELHTEALNFPVQVITENSNIASFNRAIGEEIEIFNIASRDDCIVPYAERYPYNSALINGFGYLYREIGRGDKKGLGLADCFITDDNPLDPRDIVSVLQLILAFNDADKLNIGAGHERYFWHPRIWMDLKDLILYGIRPVRMSQR